MSSDRLIIFDTTLRDGEQSPGCTMNLQEKLRMAHQLELLGVDVLEAGFPASSQGDFEAVQAITRQSGPNIQICGLARCMHKDIDRCWEAIKEAANPRIHTFLSTSDLHMTYKLRKTPDEVIAMIKDCVARAASYTPNVEFSCEDASRSDKDFLCKACATAIAAGATTINLPDTVGYAAPSDIAEMVSAVRNRVPNMATIYIRWMRLFTTVRSGTLRLFGCRMSLRQVSVCGFALRTPTSLRISGLTVISCRARSRQ